MNATVPLRTVRPTPVPSAVFPGLAVILRSLSPGFSGLSSGFPGLPDLFGGLSSSLPGLAAGLLLAGLSACDDGNSPTGPVAPEVVITAPASGSTALEGSTVQLQGSAVDPQDGRIPAASLAWTSSIDGDLGSGESTESSDLSVGIHTIVLSATDSDGNRGQASISLAIQELDFLDGTVGNPEMGLIVSTLGNALRLFQLGDPQDRRDIPLGASSTVTATGISVWGERAAVPLGNAASVAILNLRTQQVDGFFLFESGNATGSAFVDQETVVVANQETDRVGRIQIGQTSQDIQETVGVPPFPSAIVRVSGSRVAVISSNLDDNYLPAGDGVVTILDPSNLQVLGTVETGGLNPQYGAIGPDGLLYVSNTGDYVQPSTLAVIDPQSMIRMDLVDGFSPGSGDVFVDPQGLVYVSGFFFGTVIWDSESEIFVRGPGDPVCAPLPGGGCRGASASATDQDGALYQTFFGSPAQGLSPWVFQYAPGSFELSDSVASGPGPVAIQIRSFR